jgi:hypothetical protein
LVTRFLVSIDAIALMLLDLGNHRFIRPDTLMRQIDLSRPVRAGGVFDGRIRVHVNRLNQA